MQPLREWKDYETIEKRLPDLKGTIEISGCMDAQKAHLIYGLGERDCSRLIVTFQEQKAKEDADAKAKQQKQANDSKSPTKSAQSR